MHLLQRCDEIIRLDDGSIAEQGTYDELKAAGGKLAALVDAHVFEDTETTADAEAEPAESSVPEPPAAKTPEPEPDVSEGNLSYKTAPREGKQTGALKSSVYASYFSSMGWGTSPPPG